MISTAHISTTHIITEDAIPDALRRYVHKPDDGMGWTWFHHPLLILHLPSMLQMPLSDALRIRREAVDEARAAGDWSTYVFRHERAYRFDALFGIADEFGGAALGTKKGAARFWRLAANVWTDGEHSEASSIWSELMDSPVQWRGFMTPGPDRRRLRAMAGAGGRVRIFRGVQARTPEDAVSDALGGWSWTASRDVAAWFAHRWLQPGPVKPYVATATVHLDDVAAFLTGRGEEEILIDPELADQIEDLTIEPAGKRPARSSVKGTEE